MINAYDFDETIYDGDSSVDFYFYCLKRNKKVLLQLPIQLWGFLLYKLKITDKTRMKERVFLLVDCFFLLVWTRCFYFYY